MSFGNTQIEFPVVWHYKIITEADKPVAEALQEVLNQHKITDKLTAGQVSKNGSYQTYKVSVEFHNKETMDLVSKSIGATAGVKFML